jgi:hypothetical protein
MVTDTAPQLSVHCSKKLLPFNCGVTPNSFFYLNKMVKTTVFQR